MAKQLDYRKYKVLHIPTSSYLMFFNQAKNQFEIMIFANKAKAGHGIEDYRKQNFNSKRSYNGHGLFLEFDVKEAKLSKSRYGYDNVYYVSQMIRESIKTHGEFHKSEFELIPIEDADNVESNALAGNAKRS